MIDGKNFSSLIKNKFEKPFDDWFIETMNQTAEHVAKNIQNCVGAYVQSDEISFLIKDDSMTCLPFDGRLCKLLSIIPATATSFFTKKIIERNTIKNMEKCRLASLTGHLEPDKTIKVENGEVKFDFMTLPDYVFDCKVWSVPNENDAIAWFLYRQNDCIRNSKQQFCQTYLPHKRLVKLNCDEQVKLCKEETGNDWNSITDDKKYGRFLYKDVITKVTEDGMEYQRRVWKIFSHELNNPNMRDYLKYKWLENDEI